MWDVKRKDCILLTSLPYLFFAVLGLLLLWAAPALAQEPTAEPPVYVVQPGDTLYSIAQRFDSTVEAIVAANDIENPRLIQVGQKLVIPTAQPELVPRPETGPNRRLHPVRQDDTLPSLAFRYRTTVWKLRQVNNLGRLGLLQPGQELLIPPPTLAITGSPTFPLVRTEPEPVVQGQTLLVEVQSDQALPLTTTCLGHDLHFIPGEGRYWALLGVDALTPPGDYPLTLVLTETVTGDRLTMHETLTISRGSFGTYNVVIPADRKGLLDPALVRQEREKVNAVFAGWRDEQLWQGAFQYPLAGELLTTAPFGQRRSYNGGPVSSYHTGHDYDVEVGQPVYAPADGIVALAEPLQVRGKVVIIDHGLGVFTGFWHLSQIDVTAGQAVEQGQVVGLAGNTGLSTGPHLHWEMRVGGVPVDAEQWVQRAFP